MSDRYCKDPDSMLERDTLCPVKKGFRMFKNFPLKKNDNGKIKK